MTDIRKTASVVSVTTAIGLLTVAASGGIWVGAIANDVDTLKKEKDKVEQVEEKVQDNSEVLASVETAQKFIIQEQARQSQKLDKIIDKLEDME